MTPFRIVAVVAVAVLACNRPQAETEQKQIPSDPVPAAQAEPAPAEYESMDSIDDPEYKARVASMATYQQCIEQARTLAPEQRQVVEKSCQQRRGAPQR